MLPASAPVPLAVRIMDPPAAGYLPTLLPAPSPEIFAKLPDLTEYLLTLDGAVVAFVGVGVGVAVCDVVGVGELVGVLGVLLLQPANASAAAVPNPAVTVSVRVREIMWVLFSLVYVKRENNASSPIMCDHLSLAAAGPATVAVSLGWCPGPLALAGDASTFVRCRLTTGTTGTVSSAGPRRLGLRTAGGFTVRA